MRLNREAVAAWFGEVTAGSPLPDLIVDRETADLLERTLTDLRAAPSFDELDPGCYLFFLAREPGRTGRDERVDLEGIAERIERAGREANRRLTVRWERPTEQLGPRSRVGLEPEDRFGSYIVLAEGREVPSVGPGGRVVLDERDGTVTGSASVRPFVEGGRAGSWISIDAVDDELASFYDRTLELTAEFGYYETSWMERQIVIRPTFVFVIENELSAEYPMKWVVTVSATTAAESFPQGG